MYYKRILIRIVFFLCVVKFQCYGQESNIILKNISVDEMLPGSSVQCVFQDSKGLMWYGIEDVGLCKYNGKLFKIYQKGDSNSISNNFPLTIVEDKTGKLWIGTAEGLNVLNRQTGKFTNYFKEGTNPNCIPNNYINDLMIDRYNNIWIGTKKGLSKYNDKTKEFINLLIGKDTLTEGLPVDIFKIFEDRIGNIWIGTYSSGLFKIDSETNKRNSLLSGSVKSELKISKHWFPILKGEKFPNYAINQICEYDNETLLLGKINGLFLFNSKTESFSRFNVIVNPELQFSSFSVLLKDSKGLIWAGTYSNGLLIINKSENSQIYLDANKSVLNGLRSNSLRDIYEDNSGLIWIATKFGGLFIYDKKQEIFNKNTYNRVLNTVLDRNFVLSILSDKNQNLWIGTKSNGLYQYNLLTNEIKNYKSTSGSRSGLCNNRIECLAEDIYGNIWIGSENGIYKFEVKTHNFKLYTDYFIRSLVSDKNGNVWIGTNSSGILFYNYKSQKCERYKYSKHKDFFEIQSFPTRGLSITGDSLLWISTLQEGLYKYNLIKDELVHFKNVDNDSSSLSGNMARAVIEDKKGQIWVSTKLNGLNRYNYNTQNFSRISIDKNRFSTTIYSLVEDNNGNLWMGTHAGLLKLNSQSRKFEHYNELYGLKNNVFEPNARGKTTDGLLIFGGSNGLNIFDPEKVFKSNLISKLIISSIKVYDKTIAEDVNQYSEFDIHYDDKYFSIEFALTEFSNPTKVKYKYKLENFDNDWIESGNINIASFTALPPGEYYFNVIAVNYDNVESEPLRIKITILSPLWRKPLFIIFSGIILFSLFLVFYILRLRFIRENELKLKVLVKERTEELTKANQELESHKLKLENLVDERTADLVDAKKRAEESDKLKSAFLANMSHEIRSPLNVIIGMSNILLNKDYDEEETDIINNMIETNSKALLQLINDIIDISKIEANQIKIYNSAFPLNACIKEIVQAYLKQEQIFKGYREILLLEEVPDNEIIIISDRIRVEQVIKNLINNALKFTKTGSITIGYTLLTDSNPRIRIYVRDTGIGIPENELKLIFERFKHSESKDNIKLGGTGLGLSISINLARLMGGTMWAESEINKGSTFFFEIPLTVADGQNTGEEQVILLPQNLNWQGKTLLIAEDDDANFRILTSILNPTRVNLIRVNDGVSAINAVVKGTPKIDLILMDIKLPILNGIEAMLKIKSLNNGIYIIAQTAFAMEHEERDIINAGFNDYISKPILSEVLLKKISKYLN